MTPEERAALWAELDTMKDALEELRKPAIRLTSAQAAEIMAELKRMRAAGLFPIVVKLTGDAAKDAAALEEANAKRAEVEIATGRAPGLIVFDP
jgi:threonine synthase